MMLENLWARVPGNVWLWAVAWRNLNGCALASGAGKSVAAPESSWSDVSGDCRSSMDKGVATKGVTLAIELPPR